MATPKRTRRAWKKAEAESGSGTARDAETAAAASSSASNEVGERERQGLIGDVETAATGATLPMNLFLRVIARV